MIFVLPGGSLIAERITITEADLRRAIRDDRYWRADHPEREAYGAWVTEGFRALHGPEARGGTVQVRAYTRTRNGRSEQVGEHTRGAPAGHGSGDGSRGSLLTPAQAPFLLFARPPILPRAPGAPREMRRIPNQSGKDAASDIPSFARGFRRYVGETPDQFANRVMNDQYRGTPWRESSDRMAEFRQIKKFGQRAFEMPSLLGIIEPDEIY